MCLTFSFSDLYLGISNKPTVTREDLHFSSIFRLHSDVATEPVIFNPVPLLLQPDQQHWAQRWGTGHFILVNLRKTLNGIIVFKSKHEKRSICSWKKNQIDPPLMSKHIKHAQVWISVTFILIHIKFFQHFCIRPGLHLSGIDSSLECLTLHLHPCGSDGLQSEPMRPQFLTLTAPRRKSRPGLSSRVRLLSPFSPTKVT